MKKWFRIHLSTALILTVLAWPVLAFFLWLNRQDEATPMVAGGVGVMRYESGWPLHCCMWYEPAAFPRQWDVPALLVDLLIPLALLWAISRVCEWRIARYERRRGGAHEITT